MAAPRVVTGSGSRLWAARQLEWGVAAGEAERETLLSRFWTEIDVSDAAKTRRVERRARKVHIREGLTAEAFRWWMGLVYDADPVTGLDSEWPGVPGYGTAWIGSDGGTTRLRSLWPRRVEIAAKPHRPAMVVVDGECELAEETGPVVSPGGAVPEVIYLAGEGLLLDDIPVAAAEVRIWCKRDTAERAYRSGVDTPVQRPRFLGRRWGMELTVVGDGTAPGNIGSWEVRFVGTGGGAVRISGTNAEIVEANEKVVGNRIGIATIFDAPVVTAEWW